MVETGTFMYLITITTLVMIVALLVRVVRRNRRRLRQERRLAAQRERERRLRSDLDETATGESGVSAPATVWRGEDGENGARNRGNRWVGLDRNEVHPTLGASKEIYIGEELKIEESFICAVCLEDVPANTIVASLRCGHDFHVSCMSDWAKRADTCPICRMKLTGTETDNHTTAAETLPADEQV